jgi:hypothetical protein
MNYKKSAVVFLSFVFVSIFEWECIAQPYPCICPAVNCHQPTPPDTHWECFCDQAHNPSGCGGCSSFYYVDGDEFICDDTIPTECCCPPDCDPKLSHKDKNKKKRM